MQYWQDDRGARVVGVPKWGRRCDISFVVVVIGGIGSVRGALLASLLVGLVDTFGKVFFPEAAGVLIYLLMAAILLWRPEGLFKHG